MTDMLALDDMSELPTATVTALMPAQATTSSGNTCDNTGSNQNWSSAVLAVPVGSNPAYHARSMSLKRDKASRVEANQVVPGDDSQATTSNANARVGVSEAFLEDFLMRVLPQFGLTRQALSTPTTRDQWLERLSPNDKDVHVVDVVHATQLTKADNGETLVNLGDGLQARKSDVELVRMNSSSINDSDSSSINRHKS